MLLRRLGHTVALLLLLSCLVALSGQPGLAQAPPTLPFLTYVSTLNDPMPTIDWAAFTDDGSSLLVSDSWWVSPYALDGTAQTGGGFYSSASGDRVVVAPSGRIYSNVSDGANEWDAQGNFLGTLFVSLCCGEAVASDGSVVVANGRGQALVRFSDTETQLNYILMPADLSAQGMMGPFNVFIDKQDRIWATYAGQNAVFPNGDASAPLVFVAFTSDGQESTRVTTTLPLPSSGSVNGMGLGVAPNGRIELVAGFNSPASGSALLIYDASGNLLKSIPGRFPNGTSFSKTGLALVNCGDWGIKIYNSDGDLAYAWGDPQWAMDHHLTRFPKQVAFDAQGRLLVSGGDRFYSYLNRYSDTAEFDTALDAGIAPGEVTTTSAPDDEYFAFQPEGSPFCYEFPLVIDQDGNRYYALWPNLVKLDAQGKGLANYTIRPLQDWLMPPWPSMQVIAMDRGGGPIYVASGSYADGWAVDAYDLNGKLLGSVPLSEGRFLGMDDKGRFYGYGDNETSLVQYSPTGAVLLKQKMAGVVNPNPDYYLPTSIAVRSDGLVALSTQLGRVHLFTLATDIMFPDLLPDQWAHDQIDACAVAGIVQGYPDGTYQPGLVVNRDSMAVFVSRALAGGDSHVPTAPATAHFPDVAPDYWAFKYVEYAYANNIVQGYENGNYQPGDAVDRGQMAVFIARTVVTPTGDAGLASYTPPTTPTFADVAAEAWNYKHVEYLKSRSIVSGYEDGKYHPEIACTRDQMAVFIARAFGL